MAINQFDLEFVPTSCETPLDVDDNGHVYLCDERCMIWRRMPIERLTSEIDAKFSAKESWSDNLLLWGSDREILIKLWTEDGRPDAVSARIAVNRLSVESLDRLLALASCFDCELYLREAQTIIRPHRDVLLQYIATSTPYRFVKNPLAFFDQLSREPIEPLD